MVGIEIGLNTHRTCFKFTQDLKKDGCFQFQASLIWFEPVFWHAWKFLLRLDQSTRNQGISACTCKILFLKGFMAINNWIYGDPSLALFLNIWPLNYLKIKEQVCFPIKLLRCMPNYLGFKYLAAHRLVWHQLITFQHFSTRLAVELNNKFFPPSLWSQKKVKAWNRTSLFKGSKARNKS